MSDKEKDQIKQLLRLYAMIPDSPPCNEGCNKCCGPVLMLPSEARILGLAEPITPHDENLKCSFIKDGRCSVYEKRPFTCRIFGTAKCKPMNCPDHKTSGTQSQEWIEMMFVFYFGLIDTPEDAELLERTVEKYTGAAVEHDKGIVWNNGGKQ